MISIFKKNSQASPAAASKPAFGKGAPSAAAVALAVAAVVVFNLLTAQIPAAKAQIDLTDTKLYNITDTSVLYLEGVTDEVAIHVLASEDSVDSRIVRFLDKYVSLSDYLTLEYIDPVVYPSALSTYNTEANTIVVTCAATGRQETVALADIIGYDEMSYYLYQQYIETDFDAEGRITSAIDGVLTDVRHTAYATAGHGETALDASLTESFSRLHMTVGTVNLLTDGGVPDDCELLIVNAPTRDLADGELALLLDYLSTGGQVVYVMSSQLEALPNFEALLAEYGLSVAPGMVADTQRYFQNTPFLFFPEIDGSVDAASALSGDATILFYGARGMTVTNPVRESITVSPFLTTSDGGVAVQADNIQIPGVYVVGAAATEEIDDGITARLTVYGADSLTSTTVTSSFPNVENSSLFVSSATVGFEDISPIVIQPVSLSEDMNTVTTGGLWGMLFIFVIPMALLLLGFLRWTKRRKL